MPDPQTVSVVADGILADIRHGGPSLKELIGYPTTLIRADRPGPQ